MTEWLEFNINHTVRVRLTERGRKLHAEDHEAFWESVLKIAPKTKPTEYQPPKEDAEGWSEWQAWRLIEAFGKHTKMGYTPCFETTIEIQAGNLKTKK